MKKIIIIGVILVMLFSLAACKGNELAEYKAQAKADLEAYAESKGQENYSEDNWAAILGLVEDGKAAVDAAENKKGVDTTATLSKVSIDGLESKESTTIPFKVGTAGIPAHGSNVSKMTELVREQEGLISIFFASDIAWESDITFWERYDNEFFVDRALILHFFWAFCGSTVYSVETVKINGDILNINLVGRGATQNDDTYFVTLVIEVNQSDIPANPNISVNTQIEFKKEV